METLINIEVFSLRICIYGWTTKAEIFGLREFEPNLHTVGPVSLNIRPNLKSRLGPIMYENHVFVRRKLD